MAEIKSTMDLVWEKTKHMTPTDEDKQKHSEEEVIGKLRGLIQKYHDSILTPQEFSKELASLSSDSRPDVDSLLKQELVSRIDLDADNTIALEILKQFTDYDTVALEANLNEYTDTLRKKARKRADEIKQELDDDYAISGTAVVANLNVDEAWIKLVKQVKAQYQSKI